MWVRSHVRWTNYGQYFSGCPKESFFSLFCFFLHKDHCSIDTYDDPGDHNDPDDPNEADDSRTTLGQLRDHCGITLSSPSSLLSLSSLGFLLLECTSVVSPVISSFFCMTYSVCCVCLLFCRVV